MKKGDKVKCINAGNNRITNGKEYTVISPCIVSGEDGITVMGDVGGETNVYAYRFELVESAPSLMGDIERAKSLIGKKVQPKGGGSKGTVENVTVELTNPIGSSISAQEEFRKFGYAVLIKWDSYVYGLSAIVELPDMIEVPLTSDYTAKVYSDKVLVGCQTITKETFDKVAEALKQLNQ